MSEKTKALEYAEAFYGGKIPVSQTVPITESVMSLVMCLRTDITNEVGNLSGKAMHKALLAGLSALHEHGAFHPNVHKATENGNTNSIYLKGFHAAIRQVRERATAVKSYTEQRKVEREKSEAIAEHDTIAARLYEIYSQYKEHYVEAGVKNPKVAAYQALMKCEDIQLRLEGYAYYVVSMKIPLEQNIYYDDAVVKAWNEHPRTHKREFGSPKFTVNNQPVNPFMQIG